MQNQNAESLSAALIKLYESGNDVIRCAAIGALSAQLNAGCYADTRQCLLAGIRDEDPDVRVDAMSALERFAEPQDAPLIRESLIEDPVRDVKISAIEILTKLADQQSIPLLLQLAQSRASDEIAWEDETDIWDDWLDVQISSISALAKLHVDEAVPLFLELRNDEYGQELDPYIFPALAIVSSAGLDRLLDLARNSDTKSRTAALLALSRSDSDLFQSLAETLAKDDVADFRLLGIAHLEQSSPLAEQLALRDPDPAVRQAAVSHFGRENQQLVWSALGDEAEAVSAVAVNLVELPLDERLADALVTNGLVWLKQASTPLAVATAKLLPKLSGENAVQPLADVLEDGSIALETRIAAARALADTNCNAALNILEDQLKNPSQQVRAAALSALTYMTTQDSKFADPAISILTAVISGARHIEPENFENQQQSAADHHLEAPKTEGFGRPTVRISEDGEIIEDVRTADCASSSTLGNMEFSLPPKEGASEPDTAEAARSDEGDGVRGHHKKRRRVSVEGPDAFSEDLCARAIDMVAGITVQSICDAVETATASESEMVRHAAISNLAKQIEANGISESVEAVMIAALEEENPAIRTLAAQALGAGSKVSNAVLDTCLSDADPIVRAFAVEISVHHDTDCFAGHVIDPSRVVRKAALTGLANPGNGDMLFQGLRDCLEAGYGDTLVDACCLRSDAYQIIVTLLSEHVEEPNKCLALINALAQAGSQQASNYASA